MATYLDLTGTDERFKVEDHRINIFPIAGSSFVINLTRPAYESSITVYNIETMPYVELNKGIDWIIRSSDVDYNAMGKARLADPNFSHTLVKSITVVLLPNPDLNVSLSYNTLEMSYVDTNSLSVEDVILTPELIHEISRDVAYLRDTKNPIEDLLSESVGSSPVLEVDLLGTSEDNLIQGEVHTLNAQLGKVFIRPNAGSFYKAGLEVRLTSNNSLLTLGTDYRVICCNVNKTSQTSNPSGVYDVIHITAGVMGGVSIKYQAFGGEVSRQDLNNIFKSLINVVQYINSASFLTPDTIGGTSVFLKLLQRIGNLEETVRILSTSGTPTYADSTNGKSFLHKFSSPDSVNKHWYTIAKLRTVAGSGTVYTKSSSRYKIQCANAGLMFDVSVAADIDNNIKPLEIKILSSNDKENYIPYNNYIDIEKQITPEFRLIWNEEVDVRSGAFLQIGFNLKHIGVETVAIEDWSGSESCWITLNANPVAVGPSDDLITLPNGSSIWSTSNPASQYAIGTYTPKRGYLAWAGSVNLNDTTVTAVSLSPIGSAIDYQIYNISKVCFHIWDRIKGRMILCEQKVLPFNNVISINSMFYPEDLCSINFNMSKSGNNYLMSISSLLGNYSEDVSAFEIREITFEF